MRFGVSIFFTHHSIAPSALAAELERRRFESLWVAEHSHIPSSRRSPWPGGGELPRHYYEVYDPLVALAAASSVTTTLKLGTGVCLVIQRDPIQLAKEVATLDRISDGRFLFGIGGGWNAEEMADHGTEFRTRFRLMRERIEAMKAIWTREEAEYHGDLVDFGPMKSWPKPVQQPHPPIIVGGGWPHAAKRAIAYGDGWIPLGSRDLDVAALVPEFRRMAEAAGRDPATLELTVYGMGDEPDKLAAYREVGIDRVVFRAPAAGADAVLPLLDRYAELAARFA
jgi:probable F420-dependent oxidoreductase